MCCKYGSIYMNAEFVIAENIRFLQHILKHGEPALPFLHSYSYSVILLSMFSYLREHSLLDIIARHTMEIETDRMAGFVPPGWPT